MAGSRETPAGGSDDNGRGESWQLPARPAPHSVALPGRGGAHGVGAEGGGLIGLFVRHPTAANLLMVVMIVVGLVSLQRMNTQFFPTIEIPSITVTTTWTGASSEDVEANIIEAIEPELRFLDGVDEVTSIAREGVGVITLEFFGDADMQKAQSDVEQAVARITTLPEDSDEPEISRITFYEPVAQIAISGPFTEGALKTYAKDLRDGLLDAGIDRVTLTGARAEEITVELAERELRRLDLTLADVASRIGDNTRDLPSGIVEGAVDVQVRSLSERRTPEELADIEIKSTSGGEKTFLRDIATIETTYDDDDKIGLIGGERAVLLTVQRAVTADTLKTMETMFAHMDEARAKLPDSLKIKIYDVRGKFVKQRLGILLTNGIQGLFLVLIVLFLFLDSRIAFWTAMGIPTAFLATLAVMYASGQTINMISMFALILMLGIIVDDAIVVGEHTATRQSMGDPPMLAAQTGALKMLTPVLAATLTTQVAFFPLFLISGRLGDILMAIPLVVTAVLIASIIECFLILPGHMRHTGAGGTKGPGWFRRNFDRGLDWFRNKPYDAFVSLCYHWRYASLAFCIAGLLIAFGLLSNGHVKFRYFPSPEPENLTARLVFGAGTPKADQRAAVDLVEQSLYRAERRLLADNGAGDNGDVATVNLAQATGQRTDAADAGSVPPSPSAWRQDALPETSLVSDLIRPITLLISGEEQRTFDVQLVQTTFSTLGQADRAQGENLAQVEVQLTPSEVRTISSYEVLKAWRAELPEIPGVERMTVTGRRVGPPGKDVDVRLQNAPIADLKAAAGELKQILSGFAGVSAVDDDLPYGRPEIVLELKPRGTALGFTGESVGTQVRNAFEGAVATRFARGDEEITVRVQRRQESDGSEALTRLYLRAPGGQRVPLPEVVTIREKQGFALIQRRDGVRTVAVTGDIDGKVTNTPQVVARLQAEVMPELAAKYGLEYEFKGRDEERRESFADLQLGAMLALCLIYIILAWIFESYFKPLAVMSIIPFGIVGAIIGHLIMDAPLTIISFMALLGLSGILVNDSIIVVMQFRERWLAGQSFDDAAIGASRDRFRAVLLTSLTTCGGLIPLLFEESRQAQFLIPMAITLVFGLGFATLFVLVLVPVMLGIGRDIGLIIGFIWRSIIAAMRFLLGGRFDHRAPGERAGDAYGAQGGGALVGSFGGMAASGPAITADGAPASPQT